MTMEILFNFLGITRKGSGYPLYLFCWKGKKGCRYYP